MSHTEKQKIALPEQKCDLMTKLASGEENIGSRVDNPRRFLL